MPALLLSDGVSVALKDLATQEGSNAAISKLKSELAQPPQPEQDGAKYPDGTIVNHQCLVQVAKWAASSSSSSDPAPLRSQLQLSKLLKGAQIAVPIKAKPERSPELVETLRKIQLAQEEAEYEEMLNSNITHTKGKSVPFGFRSSAEKQSPWRTKADRSEAEEWEEVKRQVGAIANVGLSVAAVVVAVWWAAGNADPIWKTLIALPLSILVAVAEVALYARHWDNVQKRKEKTTSTRR